jgi:hypothetical protein
MGPIAAYFAQATVEMKVSAVVRCEGRRSGLKCHASGEYFLELWCDDQLMMFVLLWWRTSCRHDFPQAQIQPRTDKKLISCGSWLHVTKLKPQPPAGKNGY